MTKPQVVAHRGSSARLCGQQLGGVRGGGQRGCGRDRVRCAGNARPASSSIRHDLAIEDRLVADLHARRDRGEGAGHRRASPISWHGRSRWRIELARRGQGSRCAEAGRPRWLRRARGATRSSSAASTARRLAAVKARTPKIRTSLMMGSVVGPEDLVRLAAAYRVDGVHPCWEAAAPRPHRLLDTAAIDAAAKRRARDHAVARGARERVAGAGRASRPMPSAPTRLRYCDASWIRMQSRASTRRKIASLTQEDGPS